IYDGLHVDEKRLNPIRLLLRNKRHRVGGCNAQRRSASNAHGADRLEQQTRRFALGQRHFVRKPGLIDELDDITVTVDRAHRPVPTQKSLSWREVYSREYITAHR